MTVIVPAWIKERRADGVVAILGSEPQADAEPTFVPADEIESVVESGHETGGLIFGVLMLRHGSCTVSLLANRGRSQGGE